MVAETSELEITTTEIIKRRDVGPYGIRSEYCIRKIICPIGVPETPKGKFVYKISKLHFFCFCFLFPNFCCFMTQALSDMLNIYFYFFLQKLLHLKGKVFDLVH